MNPGHSCETGIRQPSRWWIHDIVLETAFTGPSQGVSNVQYKMLRLSSHFRAFLSICFCQRIRPISEMSHLARPATFPLIFQRESCTELRSSHAAYTGASPCSCQWCRASHSYLYVRHSLAKQTPTKRSVPSALPRRSEAPVVR